MIGGRSETSIRLPLARTAHVQWCFPIREHSPAMNNREVFAWLQMKNRLFFCSACRKTGPENAGKAAVCHFAGSLTVANYKSEKFVYGENNL
jgi:hypothetical protein